MTLRRELGPAARSSSVVGAFALALFCAAPAEGIQLEKLPISHRRTGGNLAVLNRSATGEREDRDPPRLRGVLAKLRRSAEAFRLKTGNAKAVYTVITGGYFEPTSYSEAVFEEDIDRLILTDNATMKADGWQVVALNMDNQTANEVDMQLLSRRLKMFPHIYLAGYKRTLYVDGNVEIIAPVKDLFLKVGGSDANGEKRPDMAVYSFNRNITGEAKWIEDYVVRHHWMNRSAAHDLTTSQAAKYIAKHPSLEEKYPGTYYGKIIMRFRNDHIAAFADIWFREFFHGVRRDQLSFQYAALEANLTVDVIKRACFKTCKAYNDPSFTQWFRRHSESKHPSGIPSNAP